MAQVQSAPADPSAVKRCVHCGKVVTGGKRMKDSKGAYWCLDCGTADQARKMKKAGIAPPAKPAKPVMRSLPKLKFGGGGGAGMTDEAKQRIKLAVGVVTLALGLTLIVLTQAGLL